MPTTSVTGLSSLVVVSPLLCCLKVFRGLSGAGVLRLPHCELDTKELPIYVIFRVSFGLGAHLVLHLTASQLTQVLPALHRCVLSPGIGTQTLATLFKIELPLRGAIWQNLAESYTCVPFVQGICF